MEKKYSFLPFAAKVLRVVAWIVLVGGIIGSIILGIVMPSLFEQVSGATGIFIAVMGIISRIFVGVMGIIFSFLAWVFLLTTRELLTCLWM